MVFLREAVVPRCSVEKVFLEISQNSKENTCARVSFLIKLQARPLLKKRLWHRCFPVNFAKFLRTPFLQNTSGRLLLFLLEINSDFTYSYLKTALCPPPFPLSYLDHDVEITDSKIFSQSSLSNFTLRSFSYFLSFDIIFRFSFVKGSRCQI